MKKRVSLLVLTITLLLSGMNVQASERNSSGSLAKYFNFFMGEVMGNKEEGSITSLMESMEELAKNVKPEDAKKIIEFVKKQVQEGKWDSEEGIKEAISKGEDEFDVTLTETQKQQILSIVSKIKELGISPEYILTQAEKIYDKYVKELKEEATDAGKEALRDTQERIKEEVKKSFSDYFSDMIHSVKSFFKGIFNR